MSVWFSEGEVSLTVGVDLEKVLKAVKGNDISY